ncbi:hypothetical protein PENTCL1PPCAC_26228 [Pristionchus entomophagus]|uniref:G protein-coupled receptor n=1 Tax=Pristionchus entomophagus TaxID=358040 RepID=A0AAV5UAZ3_9BILA|nr:hypothetical protein PENTCL1PPCAC_26228 [Pristionchus entomophagus]
MRNISDSQLTKLWHDEFKISLRHVYEHRFYPRASIIPRLMGFSFLIADGIVLNVDWIIPMIMMHMDTSASLNRHSPGKWIVGVDRSVDSAFISQHIRYDDYEYSCDQKDHIIAGRKNRMNSRFFFVARQVIGANAILFSVVIEFTSSDEKISMM